MRGPSGGNIDDECRGDLVARERRGELSGPDCLALRAHLAQCASCRLARQVFVDLDHVSGVDLRDGARIERMSTAARRWSDRRSRPLTRPWKENQAWRTMALAASVVLVGGTASATVWWWRRPVPASLSPAMSEVSDDHGRLRTSRTRRGGRHGPSAVTATPVDEAAEAPAVPVVDVPPPVEPPVIDPVGVPSARTVHRHLPRTTRASAEDAVPRQARLLRQASDARRAGDAERAVGLYRKLQQEFPQSSEAILSGVSLGGLLLERRLPRAALTQFDGYLKAAPGGALTPEALYGKGRALAALGDRTEERRAWERLLSDFSESAYGPLARRRLSELK